MSAKPKQIIVDKDAIVGTNLKTLCDFAQNHLLLACDALLYECATTSKQEPEDMLHRYEELIKSGAYYCSSSTTFIQSECRECAPCPWFLPNLKATEEIRSGKKPVQGLLDSTTYEEISQPCYKVAKAFLRASSKFKNRMDMEDRFVGEKTKQLPSDTFERLRELFRHVDSQILHHMCVDSVRGEWIKDKARFGLSPEWITWQRVRLTDVLVLNYYYLLLTSTTPKAEIERAEHDYQDMEYVLLLSRADAILTRDKKLVEPLARAAFPTKDVFSSLDEVPEAYLCNWT